MMKMTDLSIRWKWENFQYTKYLLSTLYVKDRLTRFLTHSGLQLKLNFG